MTSFLISRWDIASQQWREEMGISAFSVGDALAKAKALRVRGVLRATPIQANHPAKLAPLALPFKPSSDPTFPRPAGYRRPPSPSARRRGKGAGGNGLSGRLENLPMLA